MLPVRKLVQWDTNNDCRPFTHDDPELSVAEPPGEPFLGSCPSCPPALSDYICSCAGLSQTFLKSIKYTTFNDLITW